MIWLYVLFVLLVFIVFIMQFVLVYEDDGISKVWAYRLFKFFQYGFRQDLNNVYDGKTKAQYETEVYEFLTGEDDYVFTKTEKDLRVIIKETPEVTE